MNPVTLDDVRAAAERVRGAVYRTPIVRLPLDAPVYAKAENLQRTGSFKLRGAYNFLAALPEAVRRRGVVAHSSGNHAQGVACAAYLFGVHATIVIPDNAPAVKVARTLAWGAEVVRCAPSSRAREEGAERLVRERGYTLVPPFDHPWIIAGQGTAGLELAEDLPSLKNVLVCVGGGGLIAGVATAVTSLLPDAQVIGVEPELAADAKDSFEAKRLRQWPAELTGRTMADGVRTQSLGQLNFELIRQRVRGFITVSEEAIQEATGWYALEAKLVVEPTGALTLAAYRRLLAGPIDGIALQDGPTALLISGGNIAPAMLSAFLSAQR